MDRAAAAVAALAVTSVAATTVAAAPPSETSVPATDESAPASVEPKSRPSDPSERLPLVFTDGLGIPASVRLAYEGAAGQIAVDDPGCGPTW